MTEGRLRVTLFFLTVGIILWVVLFFLFRSNKPTQIPTRTTVVVTNRPFPSPIPDSVISITGIPLHTVLRNAKTINKQGDLLVEETKDYQIIYFSGSRTFLLSVQSAPFETVRRQAEQEFLRKLDISQQEACQLKVSVTTPAFANPQEAGKIYPLSFCS